MRLLDKGRPEIADNEPRPQEAASADQVGVWVN